ncbi:ATP-binding protein [Bacillus cereus group sp. Bce038]|uniref:ATP-binding protein n=1 Tax=Bacillus cereus group sp. Bce038 TaxID=3445231 RepID=UPI003F27D591
MDEQIAATCIARNSCKQHKVLCGTGCPWFIDLRYQLELAGIPKKHRKYIIETLPKGTLKLTGVRRYGDEILERVSVGQGMYFYGNPGTGKTTTVSAVAMSYIIARTLQDIRSGAKTPQLVQYINVPDLLDELKRGFDDPVVAESAALKMENARKVPFTIIDDIGAEKPSEWARERLTALINHRYDNELCTFFTSNLTIADLHIIDPKGRIPSRVKGMTIPVDYKGIDRR